MKREWVRTADNSQTLWVPELQQHYHSHHGAVQESRHVFLNAGLKPLADQEPLNILEIGFGTGLNALLTCLEPQGQQDIYYHSLEKYPLKEEEWRGMDLASFLPEHDSAQNLFTKIHEVEWGTRVQIDLHFELFKEHVDLKSFSPPTGFFDLIYFDAFSPGAQSDLWTEEVFRKMLQSLKPGGVLVTYCVMGVVRRTMKSAGFEVTKIAGPPGKREMVRAYKPSTKAS